MDEWKYIWTSDFRRDDLTCRREETSAEERHLHHQGLRLEELKGDRGCTVRN